jgi:hypothetical protein
MENGDLIYKGATERERVTSKDLRSLALALRGPSSQETLIRGGNSLVRAWGRDISALKNEDPLIGDTHHFFPTATF